jgi:hypothetical protein
LKLDLNIRSRATATPTPNKIIFHAGAGLGKSTLAAHAPSPIFIPCGGEESGIAKLAENGLIPEDAQWVPEIKIDNEVEGDGWITLLKTLTHLVRAKHDRQTVVLDCFDDDGFLAHAYEHHGKEAYGGDMGPKGFMNYQNGFASVLPEIKRVTHGALEALVAKNIGVILLMHTTIGSFKNPDGADYNRYVPNVNQKYVWPMLRGWADMVLFGARETTVVVADGDTKGKAKGGRQRLLHTSETAIHEAKNRHGLPSRIKLPDDHTASYSTFLAALNAPKGTK